VKIILDTFYFPLYYFPIIFSGVSFYPFIHRGTLIEVKIEQPALSSVFYIYMKSRVEIAA
jgi:hypothetical protein